MGRVRRFIGAQSGGGYGSSMRERQSRNPSEECALSTLGMIQQHAIGAIL